MGEHRRGGPRGAGGGYGAGRGVHAAGRLGGCLRGLFWLAVAAVLAYVVWRVTR